MFNVTNRGVSSTFSKCYLSVKKDIKKVWRVGAVHISASRYLTQVIGIVQRILLARILGAANIGHIAVVKSALKLIGLPAGIGSFTAVTKFIAESNRNKEQEKNIISTAVIYNILTSIVTILIVYVLLSYTNLINDSIANSLLKLLVLLLPLTILTQIFTSFLAGQQRMRIIAKINIILTIVRIGLILALSYFFILKGWLIAQIILIVLGFLLFGIYVKDYIKVKFDRSIAKRIFKIGSWAFLGQAVGTILLQFDTLCISGIMKDAEATGIYNTAALVSQQMVAFSGGILYTVFPYVAKNKNNLEKLKRKHKEITKKLIMLNIIIYLIAILIAPYFFPLFGEKFKMSVIPFRVLGLAVIIRSVYILTNTYLDALGRTDLTFISGIFAAGINISLNLLFIPRWGIMGAAWATVTSLVISLIMREIFLYYYIFCKKKIR
ncbi:MAG: flippase [Candidatus Helarchaeota archaeon]